MRAMIVSDNENANAEILPVLQRAGCECELIASNPLQPAIDQVCRSSGHLLVLVLSPEPEAPLALLHAVRPRFKGNILAVGNAATPKLYSRAIREGADHFIDEGEIKEILDALIARLRTQASNDSRWRQPGRLFAVVSTSGGGGASTVAANMATVLAQQHQRCALIDLNLGGGDQAPLLSLKPAHSLAELCANLDRMDRLMLERALVPHESGVQLLTPTLSFPEIKMVTLAGVEKVLRLARSMFPFVVAELDDCFHPEQLQTMEVADVLILVFHLDFTSLRNTRIALDYLEQAGIDLNKIKLVANRTDQPQELPERKVAEVLGSSIHLRIPDDVKTINRANNDGIPAVIQAPNSRFSKSVLQLVAGLTESPA
jgi:pilus assembly protein CpaE